MEKILYYEDIDKDFIRENEFVVVESFGNGYTYEEYIHHSLTEEHFNKWLDYVNNHLDENGNFEWEHWLMFFIDSECIDEFRND